MKFAKEAMRLYIVTDRTWLKRDRLEEQVEQAIRGGATFVQLREKKLPYAEELRLAKAVKRVTDRYQVPFVINDHVELALECGADGVHVGQTDMNAADVRRQIGPGRILGVSAATVEQALAAQAAGADYLGVGAVFATTTKTDAKALAFKMLQDICAAVSIPVVAIGGIQAENVRKLGGSGVDGIAVVSAIFAQPDVFAAAKQMRNLADKMAGKE